MYAESGNSSASAQLLYGDADESYGFAPAECVWGESGWRESRIQLCLPPSPPAAPLACWPCGPVSVVDLAVSGTSLISPMRGKFPIRVSGLSIGQAIRPNRNQRSRAACKSTPLRCDPPGYIANFEQHSNDSSPMLTRFHSGEERLRVECVLVVLIALRIQTSHKLGVGGT